MMTEDERVIKVGMVDIHRCIGNIDFHKVMHQFKVILSSNLNIDVFFSFDALRLFSVMLHFCK